MNNVKIQLGAGGNILPGWLNFDQDVDISKTLPFADNSVDRILAEHVTEHISQAQCLDFFKECHRCLKPGGVLRVCTPVLRGIIRLESESGREHAEDLIRNHGHQWIAFNEGIKAVLWVAGFTGDSIRETGRKPEDGHHKAIGLDKDDLESLRVEATK